jgi:hypothetical protein
LRKKKKKIIQKETEKNSIENLKQNVDPESDKLNPKRTPKIL